MRAGWLVMGFLALASARASTVAAQERDTSDDSGRSIRPRHYRYWSMPRNMARMRFDRPGHFRYRSPGDFGGWRDDRFRDRIRDRIRYRYPGTYRFRGPEFNNRFRLRARDFGTYRFRARDFDHRFQFRDRDWGRFPMRYRMPSRSEFRGWDGYRGFRMGPYGRRFGRRYRDL